MPRGRPTEFVEIEALNAAMLVFWHKGLAATSLDDLADAMSMNRPSIYNAFGGKEDIYRRALAQFCGQLDDGLKTSLQKNTSLRTGLLSFYEQAIEVYCGQLPGLGCLMICTAPAAALDHPRVGEDLAALIQQLDQALCKRLLQAQKDNELSATADPEQLAKVLQAILQTIALRARAGETRASLRKLAVFAVEQFV